MRYERFLYPAFPLCGYPGFQMLSVIMLFVEHHRALRMYGFERNVIVMYHAPMLIMYIWRRLELTVSVMLVQYINTW